MENYEKLEALLNDDAEREAVFVESVDETLANLAARGIQITKDEFVELVAGVLDGGEKAVAEGELSEGDLENVAGGRNRFYKITFFQGYNDALEDSMNGGCKKPTKGTALYKLGYRSGARICGYNM